MAPRERGTGMARDEASFGINTYSYTGSHSAADCLSRLADQGHTDFELMMVPGHFWPAHADAAARRALRQLVEARGLRLVSLNAPNIDLNIAALAEEMRRHTLGLLHAILGLAGDLGVPGVVIGPGKANPLMPAPEDVLLGHFLRALDELAPHAERLGTKLYVENMPFAFLPKADQLMAALKRYDDERIKVVYDVANGHFAGEDPGAGCAGSPTASPSSTSRTRRARPIAIARSARAACRSPRCHWCSRRSATATRRSSRSSPPTPTGRSPTASAGCSSWAGGAASGARASALIETKDSHLPKALSSYGNGTDRFGDREG
jgi:L-ribulose-5-phosphate 3-epimerase